ncbi:MAG: HNH endonuclease [Candidatus Berkelbacteria bacterium]|nr:HNH endonuclease [Candidatus Berkelbacteria bacterium]
MKKEYDKRTLQQNKVCKHCGVLFHKHKKFSRKQWDKTDYCSLACNGARKRGITHSNETRLKLSIAHKGTKKPWAGHYKHSKEHKLAVSGSLKAIHASERGVLLRKNMSLANLGKKRSPVSIEKMRVVWKTRPSFRGGKETLLKRRSFYQRLRESKKINNGGTHTFEEWESLKENFKFTCPSCKRSEPEVKLTRDHIIPLTKGGTNDIENIQPLCHSCNSSKHTKIIKYENQNIATE